VPEIGTCVQAQPAKEPKAIGDRSDGKNERPAGPKIEVPADQSAPASTDKPSNSLSELFKRAPQTGRIVRRDRASEEELRRQLRWAPEVSLRPSDFGPILKQYESDYKNVFEVAQGVDYDPATVLAIRPDLNRLPMRVRRITPDAAAILGRLSVKLRFYLAQAAPPDDKNKRPNPVVLREAMRVEKRGKRPEWLRPEVVPVLLQLLMHEDKPVREMLIDLLGEIDHPRATVALAQRAIYDLSPELRETAIGYLRTRAREDARPILVAGLSYPWGPVADHAAEALAALDDREVVPQLVGMLDRVDPGVPRPTSGNRLIVHEIVAIKHLANCLMCHPPSPTARSPVPGIVPEVTLRGINTSGYGSNTHSRFSESPLWIRADVTYLRQDFAVMQAVQTLPGTSVTNDFRFDYLVRTRTISSKTLNELRNLPKKGELSEQRQALLFALRELTGSDRGQTFAEWRSLLPDQGVKGDADTLVGQLIKAPAARRVNLIMKYRDNKERAYGDALEQAIPRLPNAAKAQAREALADRLARQAGTEIAEKLQGESVEARRAALAACITKEEKSLVGQIIPVLDDDDPAVARLAHRALKTLTGQDFGPTPNASKDAVASAVAAWNSWWRKRAGSEQKSPDGP
jgi:HEAT repeat protein